MKMLELGWSNLHELSSDALDFLLGLRCDRWLFARRDGRDFPLKLGKWILLSDSAMMLAEMLRACSMGIPPHCMNPKLKEPDFSEL